MEQEKRKKEKNNANALKEDFLKATLPGRFSNLQISVRIFHYDGILVFH